MDDRVDGAHILQEAGQRVRLRKVCGQKSAGQTNESAVGSAPNQPIQEAPVQAAGGSEATAVAKNVQPTPAAEAAAIWTTVVRLSGKANSASKSFDLTGSEARMKYTFQGAGDMVLGSIYLLDEGTDHMEDGGFPEVTLEEAGPGTTALHKSAGSYYLDVNSAGFIGWTVTIEEKK